ncbi:MAG: hypothetical protein KatS3mg044_0253 [Rhodothermaceae bacterium]|nr:MAG: hypothetical protein KatS3mg044_0253 [Rhodothermaceae bacterium]
MCFFATRRTSLLNLRAYRRARHLASTIFWITRRAPRIPNVTLSGQLRACATAIPTYIEQAWLCRHDPIQYQQSLQVARQATQQLGLWLQVAYACDHLSTEEHRRLMQCRDTVERLIGRLRMRAKPA